MDIPVIGVEDWLNVHEMDATWDIAQSTISSLTMGELRALDGQEGASFYEMLDAQKMNYGWIEGSPEFKDEVAKLYDRERGSATCIGQKFTVTLEITEKKGGSETTQTYTIPLPKNMDGIIINLPAYLAGLGEDAYLTEFIPSPDAEIVEEDTPSGDDFGMDDMTMDEVPVG